MIRNRNYYKEFLIGYNNEHDRYVFILYRDGLEKAELFLIFLYDIYYLACSNNNHFASNNDYKHYYLGSLYYLAKNLGKEYLKNYDLKDLKVYNIENYNEYDQEKLYNSVISEYLNVVPDIDYILYTVNKLN